MPMKKPVSGTVALKRAREKNACKKGVLATSALANTEAGSDLAVTRLDQIIYQLLEHRAGLAKNKNEPAPDGRPVRGVRQPAISLSIDAMTSETIIHVKHAGLGWFSFTLGEQQVRDLLPVLTNHQMIRENLKTRRTFNT
jgi:hypothetical protein